jgi:charged multivesicular body protein 7
MNIVDSSQGIGSESESSLWRKVQGAHVVMHNLESAAGGVASYLEEQAGVSLASSLYTFESFAREVCRNGAELDVTETDVRVLVRYLERDRRLLVTDKDVSEHY